MTETPLVLVTGGSRGIGRHLAEGFAAAGHPVLLTATDRARAESAAAEIAAGTGGRVAGAPLDVADPDSVAALLDRVTALEAESGRRLRVLVNNAGVIESSEGPLWEADPADLVRVIETNTIGPLLVLHRFVPHLLEVARATGEPVRIIDLNSGSGAAGTPAYAAYSASKAALFRIADSVDHYGRDAGLRIFEMSPGVIESDMTHGMPIHAARTGDDWTSPAELVDLALALAAGGLDAWSGRYVRAGVDTPDALAARADALGEHTRRLHLDPRDA
ncbi:SDR family oxidoreductase [Brevibacterium ihuae]|uniref:SDR family oxidoreductase n=1 Tax=Brevibacterium ihuae TaxID=1631743 RepID=UPI000C7825CB|nr:SDR family NAD(P)-dependent oxidoreductase [Brevibacterium ihuae]